MKSHISFGAACVIAAPFAGIQFKPYQYKNAIDASLCTLFDEMYGNNMRQRKKKRIKIENTYISTHNGYCIRINDSLAVV